MMGYVMEMSSHPVWLSRFAAAWLMVVALPGVPAEAQLAVRPADPLGVSIRESRLKVIHSQ